MNLIKPSLEILEQGPGIEGIYEAIERAGRTCYKSTRKKGTTAKDFVDKMLASKHFSMLEHGAVYLKVPYFTLNSKSSNYEEFEALTNSYLSNPYSIVNIEDDFAYITSNLRVLYENNWMGDLQYLCEPTEYHEKRVTVRFTCDIGVSREFNRHRADSIAEQSTRYCNYSKDKFNNELSYIQPCWISDDNCTAADYQSTYDICQEYCNDEGKTFHPVLYWYFALDVAEWCYMNLIKCGWKPEQARVVLPLGTHTELIHTAFVSDWQHFCRLRTSIIAETGKPHPQASELADLLYKEFKKRNLI